MISKEEAYQLATRGMGKNVTAHMTDFEFISVVEFEYQAPWRKKPGSASGDPEEAIDAERLASIDSSEVPTGLNPVLIDKRTGQIHETGSDLPYPPEAYVECYMSTGSPCGKPTTSVVIFAIHSDVETSMVIDAITGSTGLKPAETRLKLKQLNLGRRPEIVAANSADAADLARQLRALGVEAIQRWIGDNAPTDPASAQFELDDTDLTVDFDHAPD